MFALAADPKGEAELFMVLMNGGGGDVSFVLPEPKLSQRWQVIFDTARAETLRAAAKQKGSRAGRGHPGYGHNEAYPLAGRSFVLLQDLGAQR